MLLLPQFVDPATLDDEKENYDASKYVSPTTLARTLMTLTCVEKVDLKDAEDIAKATILSSHHPSIGEWLHDEMFILYCFNNCLAGDLSRKEGDM